MMPIMPGIALAALGDRLKERREDKVQAIRDPASPSAQNQAVSRSRLRSRMRRGFFPLGLGALGVRGMFGK